MSAAIEPRRQIRLMMPSDLKSVARVESASYDYPWSIGIFRDCLLAGYYSLVLDIGGAVNGYAIMSMAAAEAHILNLCVDATARRFGYGRQLLNTLLLKAHEHDVDRAFLEVRPSNAVALRLYKKAGFVEIGVRPAYYQAPMGREDAIVLAATLRSAP